MFWFWSRGKTIQVESKTAQVFNLNTQELTVFMNEVEKTSGLNLTNKRSSVEHKLQVYAKQKCLNSFAALHDAYLKDKDIRQDIFDIVTVCETYFFREKKQLDMAIEYIAKKRNPKILIAPSSSGEELYSLCILMQERQIKGAKLLGIDLNSLAILKAKAAIYNEYSLHSIPQPYLEKYFSKMKGNYTLKREHFNEYNFLLMNVFSDDFLKLSHFDFIFSRNLMIYFDEKIRYELMDRFSRLLRPDDIFFSGHADLVPPHSDFEKVFENGIVLWKKK